MPFPPPPPPLFIPGESWQRIGKFPVARQGEPTIVVAVSQYIARAHGTHKNDIRWHLTMPITTNISHTQATCPPFFHPWRVLAPKDWQISCCEERRGNHLNCSAF